MQMNNIEMHTKEFWNVKSERWAQDLNNNESRQENEARYQHTDDFLLQQGLYNSGSDILDIGCGLGMFTVRFAQKARSVTGLDISDRMIAYARQNIEQNHLNNVSFINIPWQDIDLKDYRMEKAFDLVFASLCPGISAAESLSKMSLASRGWCFICCFARKFSSLKNDIYQRILGVPYDADWGKASVSQSFDHLIKSGYYPYVTYYDSEAQLKWPLNNNTAAHFAGHLGPISEEKENIEKYTSTVFDYLREIAVDGIVPDDTQSRIAFLYWQAG